jgi:hypothetical protein
VFLYDSQTQKLKHDPQQDRYVPVTGQTAMTCVDIEKLNGNSRRDIVFALNHNISMDEVVVMLGNGDGTFQSPTSFGLGSDGVNAVLCVDLNDDNMPDIVTTNGNGKVNVLLNTTFE